MTWPVQFKAGRRLCGARCPWRDIDEMVRLAEVAAVGHCAVALSTHSKGRDLKWRGVRLAKALACWPSAKEGMGTGSGTGGHEFPFEHLLIEHLLIEHMLCKSFSLLYTFVSYGKVWNISP